MDEKKKTATKSKAPKAKEEKTETKTELFKGRVVYGNLNCRKEPKVADGNILEVLANDTVIAIVGEQEGWYETEKGWVMQKYIERIAE